MPSVRNALKQVRPVHWLVASVLLIAILVPSTPHLLTAFLHHTANKQGYVIKYREVDFSPVEGRIEYMDVEVSTDNQSLFRCGHCMVTIDVKEILDDRYVIRQAEISNAQFNYDALPRTEEQTDTPVPYWQIDRLNIQQLDLNNLPKLKRPTLSVNQLVIEDLNRDSKKPGLIKVDLGYETSGLTLAGKVTTSPHLDFDSLDVSLRRFNVEWIPAEYRILQFDLAGVMDLKASLGWGNKDSNKRELIVRSLEYKVDDGAIKQGESGIHSLTGSFSGNGKLLINTQEMPERLIYERVSYNATISLSGNITDGETAERPLQLTDMKLDMTSDIGHGDNRETRITSTVRIPSLDHVLPDQIKVSGSTYWKGDTHLRFQSEKPNFSAVHTGELGGSIAIESDQSRGIPVIKLEDLQFNGKLSQTQSDEEPLIFQMNGNTIAKSVALRQIPGRPDLHIQLHKPELRQLSFNTFPVTLDVANLSSSNIELAQADQTDRLPLTDVMIDSLNFQQETLTINSISIGNIGIDIQKSESGTVRIVPDALFATTDKETSVQDPGTDPQTRLFIDSLSIGKDSHIKFTDHSVEPEFQTGLVLTTTNVSQLSSDMSRPATFQAEGKLGERGEFLIEGKLKTAGDAIDIEAAGRLTGLSVKQYSQYSGKLIGYQMNKGYMDLQINGTVKKKQLEGQSKLLITGLDVTALNNDAQKQFDQSLGLSLPSAISMLENNKGHIDLTVPISGDIDNPDFGMADVISKALDEGLKAGLLVAFQPLGLAVIAVDAISKLKGIPLGEIEFETGSSTLDSIDAERLALLAEKMLERPGTRLRVCAQALENELPPESLLKKSKQNQTQSTSDQENQGMKASEPEFARKLARQRLMVVRNFLIEHKVGENRFEECAPEVLNPENNKPSVKLILTDTIKENENKPGEDGQES